MLATQSLNVFALTFRVQNIKLLVQKCLQSAVQQGNQSVAFPPLGVGKKFQFEAEAVANAMVTVAYQFLQSNPRTLQVLQSVSVYLLCARVCVYMCACVCFNTDVGGTVQVCIIIIIIIIIIIVIVIIIIIIIFTDLTLY